MSQRVPGRMVDGGRSFERGVDSGRPSLVAGQLHPDGLFRNQLAWAVNTTVRGGYPKPRPGWVRQTLSFDDSADETPFKTGRFQGWGFFDRMNGEIVAQIDGYLYRLRPDAQDNVRIANITPTLSTTTTTNFTIPAVGADVIVQVASSSDVVTGAAANIAGKTYLVQAWTSLTLTLRNVTGTPTTVVTAPATVQYQTPGTTNTPRVCFEQAEQSLVIQNGAGKPLLYNGGIIRRSLENEVPGGLFMAYGWGRLWVALGRYFWGCDIFDGTSDSVLSFTENTLPFTVPVQSGPITGMQFLADQNSPTGHGLLMIFTRGGAFAFNPPLNFDEWRQLQTPLQRVAQLKQGAISHFAIVPVNGDLFYRSQDGFRSLFMASRQFDQSWANTPLGREMRRLTDRDSEILLDQTSGVLFDNRLLLTADGQYHQNGAVSFRSLAVLDFDLVSSLDRKQGPAWEGQWERNDARIQQLVTGAFSGHERCFLMCLNEDEQNEIWEITVAARHDNETERIAWTPEFPGYEWGQPASAKRLESGDLFIKELTGEVDFDIDYRPDSYPCWFNWSARQRCARHELCDPPTGCLIGEEPRPQYRSRVSFGRPDDSVCEPGTGKPATIGESFQVRLGITGYCELTRLRLYAHDEPEDPYGSCIEEETCEPLQCCQEPES